MGADLPGSLGKSYVLAEWGICGGEGVRQGGVVPVQT